MTVMEPLSPFTAADADPADGQEENDCPETRDCDIQHTPVCREETEEQLSISAPLSHFSFS